MSNSTQVERHEPEVELQHRNSSDNMVLRLKTNIVPPRSPDTENSFQTGSPTARACPVSIQDPSPPESGWPFSELRVQGGVSKGQRGEPEPRDSIATIGHAKAV